ncbi:unnamed protein product [Prunus armeniaca]
MELWNMVEDGYEEFENELALSQAQRNALKENRKKDSKALFHIYQTIEMSVYKRISKAENTKEAREKIQTTYQGKQSVKKVRLQNLRREFEKLEMPESESIEKYFTKITTIVNLMSSNGEILEDARIVEKVLRSLPPKFDYVVAAIEESNDISALSIEDLQGKLEAYEIKINLRNPPPTQSNRLKIYLLD